MSFLIATEGPARLREPRAIASAVRINARINGAFLGKYIHEESLKVVYFVPKTRSIAQRNARSSCLPPSSL